MIKNELKDQLILKYIIFFSFLIHLLAINFFPTNFEGGYGQYSDLFNSENKILYLKSYYSSQFNTFVFSGLASTLNFLIPFIDGFQAIKVLSAFSYFFLGFGLFKILKFYEYRYNFILFILIIFLNSIIWSYGFRAFNDLFAFSLAIYSFSRILNNINKKIIFFDALLLGISIALKSYNLILLIPLLFFYYSLKKKNKETILTFIIIFIPIILLNIFTYNFLGFVLAPINEDLKIAIIGGDKSRDFLWVINNFIFYIGYLTLISLPFFLVCFLYLIKNNLKKISIFLFTSLVLSFYLQRFTFISSELDLGPLQSLIPDNIYKSIIIFLFFCFSLFIYLFLNLTQLNTKKLNICKIILATILLYLLSLSFIKASQRYLILPIPFIYLIIFNYLQPKLLISLTIICYVLINSLLLANYYIVGKSTNIILNFLKSNEILENTIPNVITPHVYHLYNNNVEITDNKKITIKSSNYKITDYNKESIFSSKINFFRYEIKKFSVIKIK